VNNTKISDHMPVILHMECDKEKHVYPFKFNSVWLEKPNFLNLVRMSWNGLMELGSLSPMDSLIKQLKLLKSLVISWERNKKRLAKEELLQIECDLDTLYSNFPKGFEKEEDKLLVVEKEKKNVSLKTGGRNLETKK